MDIKAIYQDAERLINSLIRKELIDKGHHLSGEAGENLTSTVTGNEMEGFAVNYMRYLNDGTRPQKASMKQFYFVKNYFISRGLEDKEAGSAAAATIKVWMKDEAGRGRAMSTVKSERFSKTGTRNRVIDDAFEDNKEEIDQLMIRGFDKSIDEKYHKVKSETV